MSQLEFSQKKTQDEGVKTTNLYHLVLEFIDKDIILPPHQRDWVWPQWKREQWISDLRRGTLAPSMFVTYQIKGRPNPTYLNDGSQRLRTTEKYYIEHEIYGDYQEDAKTILKGHSVALAHRVYDKPEQALADFIKLQMATQCTTYEQLLGIIAYMDGYDSFWEGYFDKLHGSIAVNQAKITSTSQLTREQEHKIKRDDYALFYRFVVSDKLLRDYESSKKTMRYEEIERKDALEFYIRELMENHDQDWGRKQAESFISFVERETALVMDVWHSGLGKPIGEKVIYSLYRWLLCVAIWARNNKIERSRYEDFVKSVLEASAGSSVIKDPKGKRSDVVTSLAKLTNLKLVCEYVGSDLYTGKIPRQRHNRSRILEGFDLSHPKPVSQFGESEDNIPFPEPAPRNRARGAKLIEKNE